MSTKWIISEKEKEGGDDMENKTRSQDFTETFKDSFKCEALTCSAGGFKVVLAVIKTFEWRLRTLDIKAAYPQRKEMIRGVYARPPDEVKRNKVWRWKKTVYSLKDATKHYYESLMEVLKY